MSDKTLASFTAPTINGLAAQIIFAATAMENIYQAEIETGGRGCTQKFSSDTSGAQIRVIRPLPLPVKARELGASINGGNFSAYTYQPESQEYGLNIITVIDDQVDIPDVRMDMIPVDIAKMYIQNLSDKVVLNINAIKIAARFYTCFSAFDADATSAYVETYTSASDNLLKKIVSTNAKLNKGDSTHGVSVFPMRDRIGLVSADYYADLLSVSGILSLGGANYGYDILKKGGLDANSETPDFVDNGFMGVIVGIPFHCVSDLVLETASEYLGFNENVFSGVVAHISSAHGNLFGLATGNSINVIPCPNGQGARLQPKYRMGAACILPKSVAWLVANTWVNPYGLKDLLTASSVVLGYKAPGSRPTLDPTVAVAAGKKLKVVCDGAEEALYVVSTTAITTVGGFITAFGGAAAVKGNILKADFDTDVVTSAAAADVVYVLCVAADGTLSEIKSATILN